MDSFGVSRFYASLSKLFFLCIILHSSRRNAFRPITNISPNICIIGGSNVPARSLGLIVPESEFHDSLFWSSSEMLQIYGQ